jgi:hypothetical protein
MPAGGPPIAMTRGGPFRVRSAAEGATGHDAMAGVGRSRRPAGRPGTGHELHEMPEVGRVAPAAGGNPSAIVHGRG